MKQRYGICRAWHRAVWNSPQGLCGREAAVKTLSGPEPNEGGAYLTSFTRSLQRWLPSAKERARTGT